LTKIIFCGKVKLPAKKGGRMPLIRVRISQDEPVYVIGVVCKLLDIPIWTLRQLDKAGIVRARRMGKKNRLYSLKDIKRIEYVHYLMQKRHVNIHGVRFILEKEEI